MTAADKTATIGEIVEGRMPVRPSARNWGPLALFGATTSAAIATWSYVGGGFAAYYLPAGVGGLALTAGTLLGVFFVIMAAMPPSTRYGIEAVRSTRPTFGVRGSYITLAVVLAIMVGWNSVLMVFLGNAAAEVLSVAGLISDTTRTAVSVAASIIGLVLVLLLLRKGPEAVRDSGPVIAIGIILLSTVIAITLVIQVGPAELLQLPPLAAHDNQTLNFTTVIELGVAGGLSWWPYIGTLTRYARSTQAAAVPSILGLGVMMSLVLVVGLLAALAAPDSGGDPTLFLMQISGPIFGAIGLLFIIIANIATTLIGIYVSALSLKQIPEVDRRLSWRMTTILVAAPVVLIVVLFPGLFLDYYQNFLAFVGVLLGPICGVQIADYYLVRKQELDIHSLYSRTTHNRYWYLKGFNPSGLIALAGGVGCYLLLLNPLSYVEGPGFQFLTASIPAIVCAGALYTVLMFLTVRVDAR